ncbi:hypothetical protein U2P60_01245 [Brucella sp. H1_1004]|uniref:hypothetical protein n=1 Tax=Brucella sp. H1_1004 TaxID=3110109 RepID=UPI0039B520E0
MLRVSGALLRYEVHEPVPDQPSMYGDEAGSWLGLRVPAFAGVDVEARQAVLEDDVDCRAQTAYLL